MKKEQLDRLKKMTPAQRTQEYIDFVIFFNEFINHKPAKQKPFVEKDMRL